MRQSVTGWDQNCTIVRDELQQQADRLQLAQRAKLDPTAKLEAALLHAIAMEKRSATRVKRAATLLQKWQRARRRIERRIGEAEVRRIINRLSVNADQK